MVDISLLHPGCKVRMVEKWTKFPVSRMEPYKGQIMTVSFIFENGDMLMEETGPDLAWFSEDIAEILTTPEENTDFTIPLEELDKFLHNIV